MLNLQILTVLQDSLTCLSLEEFLQSVDYYKDNFILHLQILTVLQDSLTGLSLEEFLQSIDYYGASLN